MCNYCEDNSKNLDIKKKENNLDRSDISLNILPNSNTLSVTINYFDEIDFEVNYCPMCGRDLTNGSISDNEYNQLISAFSDFLT